MDFSIFMDSITTHSEPLRALFTMIAFVILLSGFALGSTYSYWNPEDMFRRLTIIILISIAIPLFPSFVHETEAIIRDAIKNQLKVDVTLVHEKTKDVFLDGKKSFWQLVYGAVVGEAFLSALVLVAGLVALAIQSGVNLVQDFFVAMAVMVSPLMLAWMAPNFSRSLGLRYLMGLLGILSWPIGLALADVITLSLIDQLDKFSLISDSSGILGKSVGKLLTPIKDAWVTILLSLWLIFSSFIMPWIMSALFKSDGLIGAPLLRALSGAMTAAMSAGLAPMATAAALGGSLRRAGAVGAMAAPIGFAEGAMRGGEGAPMTSFLGSGMMAVTTAKNTPKKPTVGQLDNVGGDDPEKAAELYRKIKSEIDK